MIASIRLAGTGAQPPGDPGDLLSQPLGDGNYKKQGYEQIPLNGDPDQRE